MSHRGTVSHRRLSLHCSVAQTPMFIPLRAAEPYVQGFRPLFYFARNPLCQKFFYSNIFKVCILYKGFRFMKRLLTTKQVKQSAEISYEALRLYVQRGWIFKPALRSYGKGNGRGTTLWWPRNVITRIEFIRTLQQVGRSVSEISEILKVKND